MKVLAMCVAAIAPVIVAGQQLPQAPRFEVASIKASTTGTGGLRASPGGRFELTGITLRALIQNAHMRFSYDEREVVGGPAWLDRDRFDIRVQTGAGMPPSDADGFHSGLAAMMRTLLAERFSVGVRPEQREGPAYNLVLARADGRLGPAMTRVDVVGCAASIAAAIEGPPREVRKGRGPDCRFGGGPGVMVGNAVTMDMFARVLGSWELHQPVFNRTGLNGSFDLDLRFAAEPQAASRSLTSPPALSDAPALFTAMREQLGLKLEPTRGPVDVLVVDRAEHPRED